MHLELSLTSEDYEQFTENIISKYRSIKRENINEDKAERIDKQIQDFAQKLCEMYQKILSNISQNTLPTRYVSCLNQQQPIKHCYFSSRKK